jgi:hypothetical protein
MLSGWCTNCEGTWNTGSTTKYAQYVLLQETGWYFYGYQNPLHVAEVAFNLGKLSG